MAECLFCLKKIGDGEKLCADCANRPRAPLPQHHLPPGTVLRQRYRLGRALGEGGFGITYVGLDEALELRVAVKEYFPYGFVNRAAFLSHEVSCSEDAGKAAFFQKGKTRFMQEARVLARFSGTRGIVDVRDFFEENNTAYIVMEYIDGVTLKQYLQDRGRLSAEETLRLLSPVMESLRLLHKENVIHRDISPDNIMLTNGGKGEVKLLDFGAARSVDGGNKSLSVMLKHGYAPYEQYQTHGNQGPWTDVYALCATIYKCITGARIPEATDRLLNDSVQPPSALGADIAPATEQALMKGLAVRPQDRWQRIDDLLDAFESGRKAAAAAAKQAAEAAAKEEAARREAAQREKLRQEILQEEAAKRVAQRKAEEQRAAEEAAKREAQRIAAEKAAKQEAAAQARQTDAQTPPPRQPNATQTAFAPKTPAAKSPIQPPAPKLRKLVASLASVPDSNEDTSDEADNSRHRLINALAGAVALAILLIIAIAICGGILKKAPEVGETYTFGTYQGEEIEWQILDRDGNKALLISKYALDCKPYHTEYTNVTWETCSLRAWLNNDFYNAAFSDIEKSQIISTTVAAEVNAEYGTDAGNNTTDKFFLLSIDEANTYFSSDEARKCAPTEYAVGQGAWSASDYTTSDGKATCWWWLRSPGYNTHSAAYVFSDGSVNSYGNRVYIDNDAVRPALWIELQ